MKPDTKARDNNLAISDILHVILYIFRDLEIKLSTLNLVVTGFNFFL